RWRPRPWPATRGLFHIRLVVGQTHTQDRGVGQRGGVATSLRAEVRALGHVRGLDRLVCALQRDRERELGLGHERTKAELFGFRDGPPGEPEGLVVAAELRGQLGLPDQLVTDDLDLLSARSLERHRTRSIEAGPV